MSSFFYSLGVLLGYVLRFVVQNMRLIVVGFIAAVLSVLVFHQGMILLMRETGLFGIAPTTLVWNIRPNPRAFNLPFIVNQCFWGGLYGAVFGLLAPRVRFPLWLWGLIVGVSTTLVGMFVIAAIRGTPIGGGWQLMPWLRSLTIALSFGFGLFVFYTAITSRFFRPALPRR